MEADFGSYDVACRSPNTCTRDISRQFDVVVVSTVYPAKRQLNSVRAADTCGASLIKLAQQVSRIDVVAVILVIQQRCAAGISQMPGV